MSDEKWRTFNCFFQSGRAKDLSVPLYFKIIFYNSRGNREAALFRRACFVVCWWTQVQLFSVPFDLLRAFQRCLYFKHLYTLYRITHNPPERVVHKISQWSTTHEISPVCCLPWNALYIANGCSRIPTQKCVDMLLDVSTFDINVSKFSSVTGLSM